MKSWTTVVGAAVLAGGLASPAAAAPIQWAGNGHWYDFVSGSFTWAEAETDAATRSHNGMSGYLATITSSDENDFIVDAIATGGWLGGSDAAMEGSWMWVVGPEAGMDFDFENWGAGEPNDLGGEDFLELSGGTWNDLGENSRQGYVVEFGGEGQPVPEPATLGLTAAGLIGFAALRRRKRA